ncbi:MAG TPA: hypothetical protein VLG12_04690 [Candidatus Saccharimonadales bacterium]|nr:hypothetical protein [Candidatus Saccharimonadales bacterium]
MKKNLFKKEQNIFVSVFLLAIVLTSCIFFIRIRKNQTHIYRNSDYLFQMTLPVGWKETSFRNKDGTPSFQITSPDKTISIQNYSASTTHHGEANFHTSEIQVGSYTLVRNKDLMEDGVTDDFVDINIPKEPALRLYFVFYEGDEEENKELLSILSTFSYYQQLPNIDSLISYTLPEGYMKKIDSQTVDITLQSPDLQADAYITHGAAINISYAKVDKNATLPAPFFSSDVVYKTTIYGLPADNTYTCYEGCFESYAVINGEYLWRFSFSTPARSKEEIIDDSHQKDFVAFIKSIKFKR